MKKYKKCAEKLLDLVKENPTLPLVAMVDGEVCFGEEDGYWPGAVVVAQIEELWQDDYTGRTWTHRDAEIDPIDFIDNIEQTEEVTKIRELSPADEESEAQKFIGKLPWTKYIVIYIDTFENS